MVLLYTQFSAKIERVVHINRLLTPLIQKRLDRGKSILFLGMRQIGKTTLLQHIKSDLYLSFIQPQIRLRYEKDPSQLTNEIEAIAEITKSTPLIILDEVQKVPIIMDIAQDVIDRRIAKLILTGSSARKLKRGENINLLPGRVIPLYLDPFTYEEISTHQPDINDLLLYGSLPEIFLTKDNSEKNELLDAYVSIYLEEEVRAEAIVRNLANFARFLELAASESGFTVNYQKLSQEIGVAHTTIAAYYQILEDCLITYRIEPFTKSKTRKKLAKTHKYVFVDLGIRRIAAGEGEHLPRAYMGHLFEQFVGLELIRNSHLLTKRTKIRYWRDPDGPEIDWLIDHPEILIPIEVKWTDRPTMNDAKHLMTFLQEYPNAKRAYIVCRIPRNQKLSEHIYAIPWQNIKELFLEIHSM